MRRASWGSNIGFVLAVAGSAIGLANIWKFPYTVGVFGGGAFIMLYLISLMLIGFPVLLAEIMIGRKAQCDPSGAFEKIGGPRWGYIGKATILTGFLVSAFYSAVAGWMLGYLVEALSGHVAHFRDVADTGAFHRSLLENPWWGVGYHAAFILLSAGVVFLGVRSGIERTCKVMMPLLFVLLICLVIKGLTMGQASEALRFLFMPDWRSLTPLAMLSAIGQSFFTLSLGQGTMVTYGSYLRGKQNLVQSCVWVVVMDTMVSLLAAVAVFTIVFSVGLQPDVGEGLVFHTLPLAFSQMPGGFLFGIVFFLLITVAALTSEISVIEPVIAYLIDEWNWSRKAAVAAVALGAFIVGVPCALSTSLLKNTTIFGMTFLGFFNNLTTNLMIPLGGLGAVLLVGRVWGVAKALRQLGDDMPEGESVSPWLKTYFWFCLKYSAPALILVVFLSALVL